MAIAYPGDVESIGAELQAMRTIEVVWEYNTKVDGSTYVIDKLNTEYANSSQAPDQAENASKDSLAENVAPALAAAHAARQSDFEEYGLKQWLGRRLLGLTDAELEEEPIIYDYDQNLLSTTGEVAILRRRGPWGRLRQDMIDNSQTIRKNVVTLGAIAANSANTGSLTEASVTSMDHTLTGTFNLECVDDTIGATKISCKLVLTNALIDGTTEIAADNLITLGYAFQDGQTGLGITLGYGSIVESGDGGAIFASWAVTTPAEEDGNKGIFYFKVVRMSGTGGNPDFRVTWYRDDARGETDVVHIENVTGTSGTTVLTMTGAGGTTITVTMDRAAAATALPSVGNEDADIKIDIDNPRVGDKWTKSSSNDETGVIATKIARRWRASLNSVANPGQTIADSIAASLSMA